MDKEHFDECEFGMWNFLKVLNLLLINVRGMLIRCGKHGMYYMFFW